jgi:hypothetical protein
MAYTRIRLPFVIGPITRDVVQTAIDPRLHDVHAMLRLPIKALDIEAGCNFTIADSLFGIVEGVSAVLWPRIGQSKECFVTCVSKYYPSHTEPSGGLPLRQYAAEMHDAFRNPMQHCLGLALGKPGKDKDRPRVEWERRLQVSRERESLSEPELEEIETAELWPTTLASPTFYDDGANYVLSVESFYAGTRRLIEAILADQIAMQGSEGFLQDRFSRPTWAGDTVRESGIATKVSSTQMAIRGDKI